MENEITRKNPILQTIPMQEMLQLSLMTRVCSYTIRLVGSNSDTTLVKTGSEMRHTGMKGKDHQQYI